MVGVVTPFREAAAQTISLSPASFGFESTTETPRPAAQTLTISNTGSSALDQVTLSEISYAIGEPTGWLHRNYGDGEVSFGSIGVSSRQDVSNSADPGALPAGTYHASYTVSSSNATNGPLTVSVTFIVAGPTLALSDAGVLNFASTNTTPRPAAQTLTISNSGSSALDQLTIGAITYAAGEPSGWLHRNYGDVEVNFGTLGVTSQQNVSNSADPGALPAGTYHASYTVSSANATNGPLTVSVTFTVAGPTLALNPGGTLSFASTSATPNPAAQNLTISNSGSSALQDVTLGAITYPAGEPTGWLHRNYGDVEMNFGNIEVTSQQNISNSVNPGALPAGTYHASYTVSSSNATNGPLTVSVTLTVAGPTLALSPAGALTFAATNASPNPAAQTLTISNTGSSQLDQVTLSEITYAAGEPTGWLHRNYGDAVVNLGGIAVGSAFGISNSMGNISELPVGTYHASYSVASSNATNGPLNVAVTLTVSATPTLAVSSSTLGYEVTNAAPNPASQNLTISNTGGAPLRGTVLSAITYSAGEPTGWLTRNYGSDERDLGDIAARSSIGITNYIQNASQLPVGVYHATYTVSATQNGGTPADGSPQTIAVTLTVTATPTLVVSSNALGFESTNSAPNPVSQNITISNTGGAPLRSVTLSAVSYAGGEPTGWLTRNYGPDERLVGDISAGSGFGVTNYVQSANQLPVGVYHAAYTVSANQNGGSSADASPQTIAVILTVSATPTLTVSSSTLNFESTNAAPNPASQNLTISNTGGAPLRDVVLGAIAYTPGQPTGWLTRNYGPDERTVGDISAGSGFGVTNYIQNASSLAPGTYTAQYTISATRTGGATANGSPQTITVTLVRGVPPVIQLNPIAASFTSSLNGPNPPSTTVHITNGTGDPLSGLTVQSITYTSGQPQNWLTASLASSTAPTELTLNAVTAGLPVGTFNAQVTVAAPGAGASSTLPVTFTVTLPPAIALGETNVSASVIHGSETTRQVYISNGGGGSLTDLGIGTVTYGASQPSGWLSPTLSSTTAPTTLNLAASAATLAVGTYTATIPVTSTAQGLTNSPQTVTLTLTVLEPPRPTIALSHGSIAFEAETGTTSPAAQTVDVTNSGTGTLEGLAVGTISYGEGQPTGWLAAALSGASAPATLTLTPTLGALAAGSYSATVPISSTTAGVTNSPQVITVSFTVRTPPTIALGAPSVTFSAPTGGANPAAQSVSVGNAGARAVEGLAVGTITYGSGQPGGWLSAALGGTSTPTSLTLTPATGTLPVGSYTATVPITSTNAVNSPQSLTVTFNVTGVPAIALSSSAIEFNATTGGTAPAAQTVTIKNGGTGELGDLVIDAVAYPAGQPIGWLAPSLSGSTAPATLTLQVNNTTFSPGDYTATLPVRSAASSNSPQTITVTYHLLGTPAIALAPTSLDFTAVAGDPNPAAQSVNVTNLGTGTLTDLAIGTIDYGTGPSGWVSATLSGATAPASINVQVTTGSLVPGTYDATAPVTSTAATNSPRTLAVHFVVTPKPLIALSPTVVSFSALAGGANPGAKIATVSNAGTGTLTGITVGEIAYGHDQPTGWLTVGASGTEAPVTITLQAATGTLAPGEYSATVPVSSSAATNSPQTITVNFTVGAQPRIALAATTASMSAIAGTGDPSPVQIAITNSGTGTLSGLVAGPITYSGESGQSWLAASLNQTSAPAVLTLHAATGTLVPGSYSATVPVSSEAADNSPQTVTVTFDVVAGPTIALSSPTANFNATEGGSSPGASTIQVTNAGGGVLAGLSATVSSYDSPDSPHWLAVSLDVAVAPAVLTLTPDIGSLAAGTYHATVALASTAEGVTNSPQSIAVTFTVAPKPAQIAFSPATMMLSMQSRAPSSRTTSVQVLNGGAGAITGLVAGRPVYTNGSGWLSASLSSTTAPATLTLRGSTRSLLPGVYEAQVPVSGDGVAQQSLAFTLEVVDLKACERALTDPTQLSDEERARLDRLGNANGTYDLGDYMALRTRLGLSS